MVGLSSMSAAPIDAESIAICDNYLDLSTVCCRPNTAKDRLKTLQLASLIQSMYELEIISPNDRGVR